MRIGYARTSTLDQVAGIEAQERDLVAAGCERVYREQVSSVDVVNREQLAAALYYLRDGDTLVVTKLDRLARSMPHLMEIVCKLQQKGAALSILDIKIDTSTPSGKLMMNVFGSVAQFEREIMLERQREGIAKAKSDGKYKGRVPTARRKTDQILSLAASGVGPTAIATQLGVSRRSVHRIIADSATA